MLQAAKILTSRNVVREAVMAFAVAQRLFDESLGPSRWDLVELERYVTDEREQVGADEFAAAWQTGQALDPDDAVDQAIEWLNSSVD